MTAETASSVWRINVAVGDSVQQDDVLAILESMNREITVEMPVAGTGSRTGAEVFVSEGDIVEKDQDLMRLS